MNKPKATSKQAVFREMVLGVLVYSVVLGFFNDYTEFLHTSSYSVTFGLALVMQILTYYTFALKNVCIAWFRKRDKKLSKVGMVLSVWAVLFFSKFMFLWVIEKTFRSQVQISGFVGLVLIIVCMSVMARLIGYWYEKLGRGE